MKPPPFSYVRASDVGEALEVLAADGSDVQILAGGQSLVPLMNLRLAAPELLLDIMQIPALQSCDVGPDGVQVGAGVRQAEVEGAPALSDHCPLLADALPLIAHPAIRNAGTMCGSIAHADPSAELPTVAVTLAAEITLRHIGGERTVPATDFYLGYLETVREPEEMVTSVRFPALGPRTGAAFLELATRAGDFALVGVAVSLTLAPNGAIADAAVAASGVDSVPFRCREAEAALSGHDPTNAVFAEAARLASTEPDPPSDIHSPAGHRRDVLRVLTRRALTQAARRVR